MYTTEKIYSIELGEDLTLPDPPRKPRATAPSGSVKARPPQKARMPQSAKESKPPRSELQFATLVFLTYVLGPFSVHLNPDNRGSKALLFGGLVSGMAGLGMFAGRGFILNLIDKGWPLWPWVLIGAGIMATAFSIWARAALLAVRRERQPRYQLPALLRKPWAVGVTGLVAPGLGLLLAGCARRGAAVIWMGWVVVAAAMIMAGAPAIWAGNQAAEVGSMNPIALETIFMLAAGLLVAGLVGWIAQALEGARQMMGEPGARQRIRGDWYAAALLVTMLGLAMVWDPSAMAGHMDGGSVVLRDKGFRLIPLKLSQGAHRLDPAPSQYAIQAMELNEELGRSGEAARLRSELDGNMASYLALVHSENRGGPMAAATTDRTAAQEWSVMEDLLGLAGPHGGNRSRYQAR